MEWFKIYITYDEAVTSAKDELFISLVRNYHSLSVSLGSVVLYRTPLDREGTTIYLHCGDDHILDKLMQDFDLEETEQPVLEELEPVYGEFLGEDVAEVLGIEITGVRAPSSAPAYAEPYRGGDAGYGFKERFSEEESRPAQQREKEGGEEATAS
jgi:hypothetical protein